MIGTRCRWLSYLIVLLAVGLLACGGSDDEEVSQTESLAKPTTQNPTPPSDEVVEREQIDFNAEEEAIHAVMTQHADAIVGGVKAIDEIMTHWLKSDSEDVFTAWTFWANTFEKNIGWQDVKDGWGGIFRLHNGQMTVEINRVIIDSTAKNARVEASYRWAVSGDLIAAMTKDKTAWKIQAIDYTNGRFGKQIPALANPAYTNPPE